MIGLSGCLLEEQPSDDQLTPTTRVGANTFSCRVNDGVWEARCDSLGEGHGYLGIETTYGYGENVVTPRFMLRAERCVNKKSTFVDLFVDSVYGPGDYRLEKIGFRQGSFTNVEEGTKKMDYYTDTTNPAYLHIEHLDTINHIASGTFEFTVKNAIGRPVAIKDGRFDVKYMDVPYSSKIPRVNAPAQLIGQSSTH